jgi:hypothetical protein
MELRLPVQTTGWIQELPGTLHQLEVFTHGIPFSTDTAFGVVSFIGRLFFSDVVSMAIPV